MPRYKFGPVVGEVEIAHQVDTGTPKLDVDVAFAGYTADGLFHFQLPPYDLTTHNQLDAVHVGLYAVDAIPPSDPAEVLNAPHHFSISTAAIQGGGMVSVDATEAPAVSYLALAVLEFDK